MAPNTTNLVNGTKLPVPRNNTKYTNATAYGTNEYATAKTVDNEVGDVPSASSSGSEEPAMEISM
jgi:hypothetical protein